MPAISRFFMVLLALAAICLPQAPDNQAQPVDPNRPYLLRPGLVQRRIQDMAFLGDNRTLVTSDGLNTTLWDAENGLVLRTLSSGVQAKVTPDRKFFWREFRNPTGAMTSRWDVGDLDVPPAGRVFVGLASNDLVMADVLDTMLLYRNKTTGQALMTTTPDTPMTRGASWVGVPSGRGVRDAARFNPVGHTVAIGDFDGKLLIYDYAAGNTVFQSTAAGFVITNVEFSQDGKLLATVASPDGCVGNRQVTGFSLNGQSDTCSAKSVITVRDAATGKETCTATLDQAARVTFTPDGRMLAVSGFERIQLVDLSRKQVTRSFPLTADQSSLSPGQTMAVHMAFSPDGKWLAETSHGPVYLFDVASGYVVRSLADPPLAHIANSVLTPDNRLLAAVNNRDRVVVTELSPGVSSRILKMSPAMNGIPAISADGSTLASFATDHNVRVWNIERAELQCTAPSDDANFLRPSSAISWGDSWRKMDLSADGSLLLLPSVAPEGTLQGVEIWDTRTCQPVEKVAPGPPPQAVRFAAATQAADRAANELPRIVRLAISPSGKFLSWVTKGNALHIWNRAERRLVASIRVPVPAVYSENDPATRQVTNRLHTEQGPVPLPDGPAQAPGDLLRFEQAAGGIYGINFSPDDSRLATLDLDGQVRLWNTADGRLVRTLGSIPAGNTFILNNTLRYTFGIGTLAFSPDGRTAASTWYDQSTPMLWDLNTGTALRPIRGFYLWCPSAAFSPDGKTLMALGYGSNLLAVDVATGGPLTTVSTFGDGQEWLVNSPDGLFDGSPAAYRQLGWGFPGKGRPAVPLEAFFADFYRPGLLPDVLAGKRISASRDLGGVDRRQARIQIEGASGASPGVALTVASTTLRIRAVPPAPDENRSAPGTIGDLRLFRNGSLVQIWPGALKPAASGAVEVVVDVPLTAGANQFVAYGFNQDNVQTAKGELVLDGAPSLARKGIAYVVAVGVNQYENREFNLRYAAADAKLLAAKLEEQLKGTHRYSDVRIVPLLDAEATKANLETVLVQLSGGANGPGNARGVARARSEDAVFLFFAGHGWAQGGRFYLIPHDLGYRGPRARLAADQAAQKNIMEHAISDRELGGLLKDINAGLIALVIDACNAGQMLESDEERQGPFNSKGLAQLAWDKGMYVLTAAQSYQAALENSQLQHGYLTYALVEEGLNQRKADRDPEDGEIDIHEWFDYASLRVPEMQRERTAQARLLVQAAPKATQAAATATDVQTPRAFYRYELGKHLSITGLKPAEAADCAREAALKAMAGAAASLTFENAAPSSARKVYELDGAGNRKFYTTLAPGGMYTANTSIGHSWVVTDGADQCVAIYTAGSRRETAVIQK